ncbi:F-box domain containing protein [Tanacetum coccineum]|uniref:F-box domain containing protein n=1 Tax=Tanacetum coccineum TaxID=301880 RepID=A0ABQ5CRS3_9ASTR
MEDNNQMIDTTDWISRLPDFIVHHILSFLESPPDLVRCSVLSKKWFDITASFPILDFKFSKFLKAIRAPGIPFDIEYGRVLFLKYVAYTTSRFCDQDVSAHTFNLYTVIKEPIQLDTVDRCVGLILKKGVKVFNIRIFINYSAEPVLGYRLPNTLLSASSLTSLTISKCEMPSSLMVDVVMFKSMKRLHIYNILVDEEMIKRLINSCPLLEEFGVHFCSGFERFCIYGHQNLQTLQIYYDRRLEIIDVEAPNLSNLRLLDWEGIGTPPMSLALCKKLKTLSYYSYDFASIIPHPEVCTDFISNLPFLENLFLGTPNKCNNLKLSSNSLKTLVLNSLCDLEKIEINAPNLLFFKYSPKSYTMQLISARSRRDLVEISDLGLLDPILLRDVEENDDWTIPTETELQDFVNAGDDLLWSDVREAMGGNEEIGPSTRSKRERYTDYDDETNVGVGLEEQVNALDDVDSDAEPVDCN